MIRIAHMLMNVDRRIIFVLVALAILLPLLYGPLNLPIKTTPEVRGIYEQIESMSERSVLLVSMDFDPSSKPELYPMTEAVIRHAFAKKLRVIGMNLWVTRCEKTIEDLNDR